MAHVGFIGLGNMGSPMATNILKAGHELTVFDLSVTACEALVALGAKRAQSAADAAIGADYVITMLPAGQQVESVYLGDGGLLDVLETAAVALDCSTIDADTARRVGAVAAERGLRFMDAPVSGGVAAAHAGTLAFMCGGPEHVFPQAETLLATMGRAIFHAGPAGAGQVAKGCNNMLLAVHMLGTCEALEMGARNGLDPAVLSQIMLASSGRNWSLEVYNPYPGVMPEAPASRDYTPGFMVDLMVKDLTLALDIAERSGVNNAMGRLAKTLYEQHQAAGNGKRDFSSILEPLQQ
jgi:3-hydroxyisobutyrate dehydrogenase